MLSEKKLKQLAEARKHIQHKPLSKEQNGQKQGLLSIIICVTNALTESLVKCAEIQKQKHITMTMINH